MLKGAKYIIPQKMRKVKLMPNDPPELEAALNVVRDLYWHNYRRGYVDASNAILGALKAVPKQPPHTNGTNQEGAYPKTPEVTEPAENPGAP